MILFAPAKINIGLQIIERRKDGFHNLQSIMVPVGLCDILEIRRSTSGEKKLQFSQSGIRIGSRKEKNLCVKAWEIFSSEAILPPVEMHLHKQIPVGAGLGGGSSNATATLKGLNRIAMAPLSKESLHELATRLGSDCPFFLYDKPMMMEGRGEILNPVTLRLDQLHLVLLYPGIQISTVEAYSGVKPFEREIHLRKLISRSMDHWRELVINDFEYSIFKKHPELHRLKVSLYQAGAIYASLSGSGSSLYGLFPKSPVLPAYLERHVVWSGPAMNPSGTI